MHDSFMAGLSGSDQPVPGGGAAAAYAGSVGLALLKKIIRLEMHRHQDPSQHHPWEEWLDQVSFLDQNLYRLRDEDGRSYLRLTEVKKSGKSQAEVVSALKKAIDCPMKIMEQTFEALGYVSKAADRCKTHLLPDLAVVCELLGAAARGADHIIRANINRLADPTLRTAYQNRRDRCYYLGRETLKLAEATISQRRQKP